MIRNKAFFNVLLNLNKNLKGIKGETIMEERIITKMGINELSKMVAKDRGLTQIEAKEITQSVIEHIEEALLNGISVQLNDLGTLKVKEVKAKPAKTMICQLGDRKGEEIQVDAKPECNTVRFSVGGNFKA